MPELESDDDGRATVPAPERVRETHELEAAHEQLVERTSVLIDSLGSLPARTDSRIPLGRHVHRTTARLVGRHLEVLRAELHDVAATTRDALLVEGERNSRLEQLLAGLEQLVASIVDPDGSLPDGQPSLTRRIDELIDRLMTMELALGAGPESIAILLERVERLEREVERLTAPSRATDSA